MVLVRSNWLYTWYHLGTPCQFVGVFNCVSIEIAETYTAHLDVCQQGIVGFITSVDDAIYIGVATLRCNNHLLLGFTNCVRFGALTFFSDSVDNRQCHTLCKCEVIFIGGRLKVYIHTFQLKVDKVSIIAELLLQLQCVALGITARSRYQQRVCVSIEHTCIYYLLSILLFITDIRHLIGYIQCVCECGRRKSCQILSINSYVAQCAVCISLYLQGNLVLRFVFACYDIQSHSITLTEFGHLLAWICIVCDDCIAIIAYYAVCKLFRIESVDCNAIHIDILEQCKIIADINKVNRICVRRCTNRLYHDFGLTS